MCSYVLRVSSRGEQLLNMGLVSYLLSLFIDDAIQMHTQTTLVNEMLSVRPKSRCYICSLPYNISIQQCRTRVPGCFRHTSCCLFNGVPNSGSHPAPLFLVLDFESTFYRCCCDNIFGSTACHATRTGSTYVQMRASTVARTGCMACTQYHFCFNILGRWWGNLSVTYGFHYSLIDITCECESWWDTFCTHTNEPQHTSFCYKSTIPYLSSTYVQ
jgi:hypothetical protein